MNMDTNGIVVIFALVAALGLLGVIAIETVSIPQHQAEARGCTNGIAFNASKGRCFGHGP